MYTLGTATLTQEAGVTGIVAEISLVINNNALSTISSDALEFEFSSDSEPSLRSEYAPNDPINPLEQGVVQFDLDIPTVENEILYLKVISLSGERFIGTMTISNLDGEQTFGMDIDTDGTKFNVGSTEFWNGECTINIMINDILS